MVIYRGADGRPGYHQTDDIHDAVGFVERMRNEQAVEQARIFRLEEVVFEYKPYYRVELQPSIGAGAETAALSEAEKSDAAVPALKAETEPEILADSAEKDILVEGEPETVGGPKKGLFGR